jgi:glycosyltransferase involved in cell wall biosynthesis
MYHGGIVPNRGIEEIMKVLPTDQELFAVILGNGENSYIDKLKQMAETYAVSDRVLFHEAVSIEMLWEYVGAADVGIVNIPAVTKSYFYSLPNKLFENIQALTPVIGSNFPEISKVISEYNIGLLVNPESTEELAEAIAKLKNDKELYSAFKQNLTEAKKILCWENESKILREAYGKILGDYEKIY